MRAVGLEQLEHPRVIAAAFPGQHRADQVREVVVADAHRVGVAQRSDGDFGRGPRSEAGQRRQPGVGLVERQVDGPSNQAARAATRRMTSARRRSTPNAW